MEGKGRGRDCRKEGRNRADGSRCVCFAGRREGGMKGGSCPLVHPSVSVCVFVCIGEFMG